MRKRGLCALMMAIMLGVSSSPALADTASNIDTNVKILVNDKTISTDAPPYILKKQGVTMVPLRFIATAFGAETEWDKQAKQVTIRTPDKTMLLTIGKSEVQINDQTKMLQVPAELRNNYTMVPLRFVSENLGVDVIWNANQKTVMIYSKKEQLEELRAAWIATVFNIDWPSKSNLSAAVQQQEFTQMLDQLKQMGMNAVFVQVRPSSDALYPSELVPWSKVLTGQQGKDPGYDPLAFMIEETHKRGMEFHAWFNPFRANTDNKIETLVDNHPAKLHPEWVVDHNNLLIYNPGIPAVREHVVETIMEVVNRYDVDGVHLDDYFYPYGDKPFADDDTYKTYNPKKISDKGDWRRDNINQFVAQLSESIKDAKSHVQFGISPFGIWRNQKTDPTGSATNGQSSYDNLYADTRAWIQNEWIDYVAPQLYWSIGFKAAAYDILVDWWVQETKNSNVKLYIGQGAYRLGSNQTDWSNSEAIIGQLKYNRQRPEVKGSIFFSAKNLLSNTVGIQEALREFYQVQ